MAKVIVYGPGLHQESPKLTKKAAEEFLLSAYGFEIKKTPFQQPTESIEVGDYNFKRKGFPVWHHGGGAYPAEYWVDYEIPKSGKCPWVLVDEAGREVDSYNPVLTDKPKKPSLRM